MFDEEWLEAYLKRTGQDEEKVYAANGYTPKRGRTPKRDADGNAVGGQITRGMDTDGRAVGQAVGQAVSVTDAPKRRNKYGNIKETDEDGNVFDSRHERRVNDDLRMRMRAGEFIGLARQVDYILPGNIIYRADFVAFLPDKSFRVYDAKSDATRKDKVYRMKKKLMEAVHGIVIEEL